MGCHGAFRADRRFLELNGPKIHRLENVITMEIGVRSFFDHLSIWLEVRVYGG
jgi:hypothetical protein